MEAAAAARRYLPYRDAVMVREIAEYADDGVPRYGARLGAYHPVLSKVWLLDDAQWSVYDRLTASGTPLCAADLANGMLSSAHAQSALDALEGWGLVVPADRATRFRIAPRYDEAEMFVKVTEGCNFSCTGCATAADVIAPGKARLLDPETADLLVESFVRSAHERGMVKATLKWAGGEPTLANAFRVVMGAQPKVRELRERYPDVRIDQIIITNGVYLDDAKVAQLKAHDFFVNVSLWGTEKTNDGIRKPRNKVESYPKILENLGRLDREGARWGLNYVLTPENAEDFPDFIASVWDTEHPDFIGHTWGRTRPISVYVAFYRAQHPFSLDMDSYRRMETAMARGFARIHGMILRGIPVQPLNKIDYLDLFNTIVTTCGSGYNYIAVGPEGVASCHEGLFDMPDNMARIRAGENILRIAAEEYEGEKDALLGPNIRFDRANKAVLSLHGGQGCPRLTRQETGGGLGVAASTSYLYEKIYPHMLSLEVMRQVRLIS